MLTPDLAEYGQHHFDSPESDGVLEFVFSFSLDGLKKHLEESRKVFYSKLVESLYFKFSS
jgi:hypothetical protein